MIITGLILINLALAPLPDTVHLTLDEALTLALRHSPQAMDAGTTRLQAITALVQGVSPVLPEPSLTITGTREETTATYWNSNITLNQVVFNPAVFAGFISGIINCSYYKLDARDKIARLVYDVTTDYLTLLKAQLIFFAARKALEQTAASKNLTAERFRLGQASRIDLLRSEAFYAQSRLNLLNAEKAVVVAQEKFKSTAGLRQDVAIRATEELTEPVEPPATSPDSLLRLIEKENPTIQMSTKLATVSRLNLIAAITRIIPSLTIYRSWNLLDTTFPGDYHTYQERATTTDGIRIQVPLVNIKELVGTILDAITGSRRARAALVRTRLQLYTSARTALLEWNDALLRYQQAKINLDLNRSLHELARGQYELGAISLVEILEVEANLAQAEAGYLSALCDTYIQSAQFGYLLGNTRIKNQQAR